MSNLEPSSLVIAVRVYPDTKKEEIDLHKKKRSGKWKLPTTFFVWDTETRTDETQRLTFGSYRLVDAGQLVKENLFYGPTLPAKDRHTLERYVATPRTIVSAERPHDLSLLTRHGFVEKLFRSAYKGRFLLTAFNFPFDISRVARDFTNARRRFAGGFSLDLWSYDKDGSERSDRFRPSICIKHIDSKRALKGFTGRQKPDDVDLIPEGSATGEPEEGYIFRGHFLDLRTLAFALTDRGYTLAGACDAFGVEHGKQTVKRHGIVTKKYVDYNRRDVLATSELAVKLLEEYGRHPIDLQATRAYSPASIGKSYLRAMGIPPILERQPSFPKRYLGYAQSAFFGGRTSAHIRKVPVPVCYLDFLSMYPSVNSLMDLWKFVTARKILVIERCQAEIEVFLRQVTVDRLFEQDFWKGLTAFVRIIPDGDILPSRGRYSIQSNDWQVAVNHLYAGNDSPDDALWFSLPDVVASVLLNNGRIPKIVDAFRIEPRGKLRGLKTTKLRDQIDVDPRKQDFFKVVIEQRKRLPKRSDISDIEKERLDKFLKVLANAASYGIYAEMHRLESESKKEVVCHGIDAEPFTCRVAHPDEPGEYCFPPMASLITGAARLMLALLERRVTDHGGTYAMEDTDSMAIVATKKGGIIRCTGGKRGTVKALSWKQVKEISDQFLLLNPYDRNEVPDSILKIEDDNYDPGTKSQRQLHCLAISAKRYALFLLDRKGRPVLLRGNCQFCGRKNKPIAAHCVKCHKAIRLNNGEDRWSEHGLGHLLNPTEPESEDREWIATAWLSIIRRALGFPTAALGIESLPAVGQITVSSPVLMKPLTQLNEGKSYPDKIKPFNFLLTCHVRSLGHPLGVKPERFHLISPYETDSRQWLKKNWIDQYSEKEYRITTAGAHGDRQTARVKTYGDVLLEYEYHPESKCADANGDTCSKQTIGLMQRRHVRIERIKYIGKESNSLEEVESGLIHSEQSVYTEYPDQRRDEWQTKTLPALRKARLARLVELSALSRSTLIEIRAGRSRPHRKNQELLVKVLREIQNL
jgi:glycosyltransferase involved in cell wall biosynthesis